jgi:hypothetical protein
LRIQKQDLGYDSLAGMNELDDDKVRVRRKEKIINSREDRLAKIMSMASGRAVDPAEIHLDRTPSPSFSETAAAGIGNLKPAENTSTSGISATTKNNVAKSRIFKDSRHFLVIVVSAIFFLTWQKYVNSSNSGSFSSGPFSSGFLNSLMPAGTEPWKILFGSFFAVEIIEYFAGRVTLSGIPSDLAIFLFVILCSLKALGSL